MADEGRGIALVILGIVAIVAVIGLVLMFTQGGAPAGQLINPVPGTTAGAKSGYDPGQVWSGPTRPGEYLGYPETFIRRPAGSPPIIEQGAYGEQAAVEPFAPGAPPGSPVPGKNPQQYRAYEPYFPERFG